MYPACRHAAAAPPARPVVEQVPSRRPAGEQVQSVRPAAEHVLSARPAAEHVLSARPAAEQVLSVRPAAGQVLLVVSHHLEEPALLALRFHCQQFHQCVPPLSKSITVRRVTISAPAFCSKSTAVRWVAVSSSRWGRRAGIFCLRLRLRRPAIHDVAPLPLCWPGSCSCKLCCLRLRPQLLQ